MEIRRLEPADAALFQEIRLAALLDSPTAFGSSYEEERDRPLALIASRLEVSPDTAVFGAFDRSELIGTIGLRRETHIKMQHKAMIWGMYVAPAHRKCGAGRALMQAAIDCAERIPGLMQVNLSVNSSNTAALQFYESMGFHAYGQERSALRVDGIFYDETHMVRFLRTPAQERNRATPGV